MLEAWLLATSMAVPAVQPAQTFVARLSTVPITVAMQETVAGKGQVQAVLTGGRLSITGTFEGLRSPATAARVHVAPRAIRGPAILDLTISKAVSGTISGSFELQREHVEALEEGSLYVQVHSEKAPDGNLWGWLLLREETR